MISCNTCPGGTECAGDSLAPVLAEIYALYAAGTVDKFDILFALSAQSEALFERYNDQLSRICWTRAALEIIADVLVAADHPEGDKNLVCRHIRDVLGVAVNAFEKFPWYVSGLIGQAPDLYEAIKYREPDDGITSRLSKREFVKLCKDVVYVD